VYAAGLVCLEILSGKGIDELLQAEGVNASSMAALFAQVMARGCHVRSETVRGLLPAAQAEVIACAIHPDPRERFADAQCFYDAFALRAPLRIARHTDLASPDNLSSLLERLPESGYRTELVSTYRIATIDARMALGKCRQIAETIARELYTGHVGEPRFKPLVNLVEELADQKVLPPDVFTHFYNIRRQGNAAMHGGDISSDATVINRDKCTLNPHKSRRLDDGHPEPGAPCGASVCPSPAAHAGGRAQGGSRARSGDRRERTLDAREHDRTIAPVVGMRPADDGPHPVGSLRHQRAGSVTCNLHDDRCDGAACPLAPAARCGQVSMSPSAVGSPS
jgi:hypothetical protein